MEGELTPGGISEIRFTAFEMGGGRQALGSRTREGEQWNEKKATRRNFVCEKRE